MKLATLVADVILNTSGFTAGVNQAKQNLNTLQQNLTTTQQTAQTTGAILVETIGTGLGTIIADGLRDALGAMWDFAQDSVQYASELETAGRRIDVVFGDNADKLDRWAQTTQDYFGVAEGSAKIYAAQIGTLLSTKDLSPDEIYEMSTALVELAGDLSAFTGFDYDTTMRKLLSGLRGETEAIEDLGLDVRATSLAAFAGISESDFGKLSNLERIKITYDYIISASEKAQGFFEKNNDTYSAQLAEFNANIAQLKQEIGEGLLPVMNGLLTMFNDLFDGEKSVDEATGEMAKSAVSAFQDVKQTFETASAIVDTLAALEESGVDTAEEFDKWADALDRLQKLLPNVSLGIDEQTKSIKGGTDALAARIAMEEEAHLQSARSKLFESYYAELAQAEFEEGQAYVKWDESEKEAKRLNLEREQALEAVVEYAMSKDKSSYINVITASGDRFKEDPYSVLANAYKNSDDPVMRALIAVMQDADKEFKEKSGSVPKLLERDRLWREYLKKKEEADELRESTSEIEAVADYIYGRESPPPQAKTAEEALAELNTLSQQYVNQAMAGEYEAAGETWKSLSALATDEQEAMLREAVTYWQKNGSGKQILPEDFFKYDESGRPLYTDWVSLLKEKSQEEEKRKAEEEKRKADEAAVLALMASAGDDEYPDDYVYTGEGADDTGDGGSTGEFSGTIIVNVYLDGQEIGDIITERVEANIARGAATGSKTN